MINQVIKNKPKYLLILKSTIFLMVILLNIFVFMFYSRIKYEGFVFLYFLSIIPICLLLSISIHEFGHLIFFKLFKVTIEEFSISLFTWKLDNNKYLFKYGKYKFFSGLCSSRLKYDIPKNKIQLALSAGGICNFAVSIFLSIIVNFITHTATKYFFIILMIICLITGIVNLLLPNSSDRTLIRYITKKYDEK